MGGGKQAQQELLDRMETENSGLKHALGLVNREKRALLAHKVPHTVFKVAASGWCLVPGTW